MLGIQGIVENELSKQMTLFYEKLINMAKVRIQKDSEQTVIDLNHPQLSSPSATAVTSKLHRRVKYLTKRVVSGTENIVKMFQSDNGYREEDNKVDKEKGSDNEGDLNYTSFWEKKRDSNPTQSSFQIMSDNSLDGNSSLTSQERRGGKKRLSVCKYSKRSCLVMLLFLIFFGLWYYYREGLSLTMLLNDGGT
eukprot:TRINITY_DN12166_c0_g1_i1.p1 TRINITY_DN12166_c0_g1~~TRINITY_DN12166_c0_g1_i1.p1  ORF type:complete len:205 (-),score=32.79 TRINITY_DN12166_c0_g1_i1:71-649(-)